MNYTPEVKDHVKLLLTDKSHYNKYNIININKIVDYKIKNLLISILLKAHLKIIFGCAL